MKKRAESISQAAKIWLDPHHPLRKETVEALQVSTGFQRRQIELAFENCFEALELPKLSAYAEAHRKGTRRPLEVYHILPANAFTAWVHGAVITLLLGHRCQLKPSARERVFPRAWIRSLEEVDQELAAQIEIVAWDETKLKTCEAVVAYGADETLAKIRLLLGPKTRFAAFGHKLSVGIIFEEALTREAHGKLVADIFQAADPFRLQGCLSPQILYVQDSQSRLRPELEGLLDVPPRVVPFEGWVPLSQELEKFSPYLSCVGYAGEPARGEFLVQKLERHQVSRVCPIREMQKPPLDWPNGGINLAHVLN